MHKFVIMTNGREKRFLAADDERHIALFEEIGFKVTGKGYDEADADEVEKGAQHSVLERYKALEKQVERIRKIVLE